MDRQQKKQLFISIIVLFAIIVASYSFVSKKSEILTAVRTSYETNSGGPRKKYNFNYDWQFAKGTGVINNQSDHPSQTYTSVDETIENPFATTYTTLNDDRWVNVSLAHTYNDADSFDKFIESNSNGERSVYGGTAFYKKSFFVPESYQGKRLTIEFEAARQAADVYINGTKLEGKYENGFIPFGYDITDYLNYDALNYITVRVDNSFPYFMTDTINGGTTSKVSWHDSHWHPNFGGLYRNSNLYIMNDLHLTVPLYSFLENTGTYVYTSNEDGINKTATVNVSSEIQNDSTTAHTYSLEAKVYDAENRQVLTLESNDLTIAAASCSNSSYTNKKTCEDASGTWTSPKATVNLSGLLTNVKRWSTDYPYLYSVECELIENENVIDNNQNDFGVRTFRFTNDQGFYLNENYLELNGWGQKSTMEYAGLGSAYPDWMTDMIIKQMKDANANYIRWGHTAGSPTQITAADKYGILVTQPGVDGEGTNEGGVYDSNTNKLRLEAFRDLIIYFRNHPSIVSWELGNQGNSLQLSLDQTYINSIKGLSGLNKTSATIAEIMYYLAATYDYGNRTNVAGGSAPNAGAYAATEDESERLLSVRSGNTNTVNYVEIGETTNSVSSSGMKTTALGQKPSVEAEYNRYEARRGVWNATTNTFTASNDYHKTSEQYAITQVTTYNSMLVASANTGGANWIFSDTTSHGRVKTEVARNSGEVDATMLEKEAYYTDQVLFSEQPATYILGHWNYNVGDSLTVKVIAKNVDHVSLVVNDGVTPTTYTNGVLSEGYIYTFSNVAWKSGTISTIAYDANSDIIPSAASSKSTHGVPASLKFTLKNGNEGLKANGSDIALVDVEVIDANGNRCISYDGAENNDLITFALSGDTTDFIWRGGYNSGIEDTINGYTLYPEAGITRIAIRTKYNTTSDKTITLNASSTSGLTNNTPLSITSTHITNNDGSLTGVSPLQQTNTYSLAGLIDPGYASGTGGGVIIPTSDITSSVLIDNSSYGGMTSSGFTIYDVFAPGSKMYSDELITFTNIPYKFYNAEYFMIANADAGNIGSDYILFTTKRAMDVYVLRDPVITNDPNWLNTFTLTTDTVIGGNGVEYKVYKRSYAKNSVVNIGGNVDDVADLGTGVNQIVLVKETSKVTNKTFFNENFTDFDNDSLTNGWNYTYDVNTSATVSNAIDNNPSILFSDTNGSGLSMIQKSFAPQKGKFKLTFKAYVTDQASANKWFRVFLSNGKVLDGSDKSNVGVEAYIDQSTSSGGAANVYISGRTFGANHSQDITVPLVSGLQYNTWNTFEITVDVAKHYYTIKANDQENTTHMDFYVPTLTQLDTVIFGSWVGGNTTSYIDDVEIIPMPTSVINDLTVDGTVVADFTDDVFTIYAQNLTSSSTITFNEDFAYESHTLNYDSANSRWVLSVTDYTGELWTYYIYDLYNKSIFDGWTMYNATDANVLYEKVDEEDTIKLLDENTDAMAYMEKSVTPGADMWKISFDFMFTDEAVSLYNNKYFRIFLNQGSQISVSDKTNVAIETYLQRNGTATNLIVTRTGTDGTKNSTATFTLGEWHKYTIEVDEVNHRYDLYIDDTLIFDDGLFLRNNKDIDTIVIGTGNSYKNKVFIKNYTFRNILSDPLEGLSYDNVSIADFDPLTLEYSVYSPERLNATTPVSLTTNSFLKSSNITRNILEQTVVIDIVDLNDVTTTYTINVKNYSERPTTKQEVIDLMINVRLNYNSASFTESSWAKVAAQLTLGDTYTDPDYDATNVQLANVYYNLTKAVSELVTMTCVTYQNDILGTTNISSDLVSSYTEDDVLENGDIVYTGNNDITFRSVPKKYMNATYFTFANTESIITGEMNFITKRNAALLIFKERNAGAIIEPGFTDTGDIVTAVDSTTGETIVYKVYKKVYNSGQKVVINTKTMLVNRVGEYNAIIAVKDNYDVEAGNFWCDVTSRYANTEDFLYSWGLYDTDDLDNSTDERNIQTIETKDNYTATHMESVYGSGTGRSMSEVYKSFAKLYGKFSISYYAFINNNVDNKWNRVWIVSGNPYEWENVYVSDTKTHLLTETYLHVPTAASSGGVYTSPNYGLYYRNTSTAKDVLVSKIPLNTWSSQIMTTVDMRAKTYSASYNGTTVNNIPFTVSTFDYADNVIFGTRATGLSDYWFRDVCITPIEDDLISDIKVNNNTINYTSLTKDYLYSASDLTTKTVTLTNGANYYADTKTTETLYDDVTITNAATPTISLNHRVYYEITKDRVNITDAVEDALDVERNLYTTDSLANLDTYYDAALLVLQNPEATPTAVDTAESNLRTALADLVEKSTQNSHFTGLLKYGNDFKGTTSSEIHITNNSSFTMNILLNRNVGPTYPLAGLTLTRNIVTSETLPAGTILTMLDKSKTQVLTYHYIVSDADVLANKTEYSLNDFKLMGTTNVYYDNPNYHNSSTGILNVNLDIAVDFKNCSTPPSNGAKTIKLMALASGEVVDMNLLTYNVYSNFGTVALAINTSQESYLNNDNIPMSIQTTYTPAYNSDNKEIVDTTRLNQRAGIILSLYDGSNNVLTLPTNSTVSYDTTNVYYAHDNVIRIPLEKVNYTLNRTVTLNFGHGNTIAPGQYRLRLQVIRSADGMNGTSVSYNETELVINNQSEIGFKVDLDPSKINVIKEGTSYQLKYDFSKLNVTYPKVVVSMYEKDGTEWVSTNLASHITNALITYQGSKYDLDNFTTWSPTLKSTVPRGTYKLSFELYSGTRYITTIDKYFIVK